MKLKDWWMLTSTAYTCVILGYAAFASLDLTPALTPATLAQTFVLCATIALLQLLWSLFSPFERLRRCPPRVQVALDALCRCLLCIAAVLGEGMGFGLVPPRWDSLLLILPVLVPVFLISYAVMYFHYRRTEREADLINQKIRGRR